MFAKRFTAIAVCMIIVCTGVAFGQNEIRVEKLGTISEMKYTVVEGLGTGPISILVDEVERRLEIPEGTWSRSVIVDYSNSSRLKSVEGAFSPSFARSFVQLGKLIVGSSEAVVTIRDGDKEIVYLGPSKTRSGISFILKHQSSYIAFFVNEDGLPGAADTNGKVYTPAEAMAFLKDKYYEKCIQSLQRARELGLEKKFLANEALVWGETYYSTPNLLNTHWGKNLYIGSHQIQYDTQGNGYQINFSTASPREGAVRGAILRCIGSNWKELVKEEISSCSSIIPAYERGRIFTTSTYVGFGGNIYFYVAGEDYTEIFRIRRTWGDPDMYAMAINGYTKDEYGKYVDSVLKAMSKDELRLLRNHVFALYGYEFKDEALNKYFDKQVWYIAKPGLTIASIALPAERAAFVERIQAEEKKR